MFLDLRTKEKEIVGRLYSVLEGKGFTARILPLGKVKSLHDSSLRNYLNGKIPPRISKLLNSIFPANSSRMFDGARSVLLVSSTGNYNEIKFDWIRKSKPLVLPPALETYRNTEKDIKKILLETFAGSGYSFVRAVYPLKILSSICSFLRYGTNGAAYIPGRKNTVSLFAFYTDLPFERVTQNIYEVLEELCCVRNSNERVSRQGNEFSLIETRMLLESTPLNKIPGTTLHKIISSDLIFNYDRLPRMLWNFLKVKPEDFWKIDRIT